MTGTELMPRGEVDRDAILKSLNLNARDPNTQALLLVCERYGLDPLLKHMVLISGRPYVTRDGYLAIAHRSGVFDGMEVVEQGETDDHYTAKVAVYRRDMSHPFTYVGRYPRDQRMAKQYGPEMAIKCAEVMSLRRAFNVTGVAAADEQWDEAIPQTHHETTAVRVEGRTVANAKRELLAAVEARISEVGGAQSEAKIIAASIWADGEPAGSIVTDGEMDDLLGDVAYAVVPDGDASDAEVIEEQPAVLEEQPVTAPGVDPDEPAPSPKDLGIAWGRQLEWLKGRGSTERRNHIRYAVNLAVTSDPDRWHTGDLTATERAAVQVMIDDLAAGTAKVELDENGEACVWWVEHRDGRTERTRLRIPADQPTLDSTGPEQ